MSMFRRLLLVVIIGVASFFPLIQGLPSVYFSPGNNIKKILIDYVRREKEAILLAMYWLTDKDLIHELEGAALRGIKVQLIIDKDTIFSSTVGTLRKNLIALKDAGVEFYVYESSIGIMHHKFCIFLKNQQDDADSKALRAILATGSFNWTVKANYANQENIIFLDDAAIIAQYQERFEQLRQEIILMHITSSDTNIDEKKATTKKTRCPVDTTIDQSSDESYGPLHEFDGAESAMPLA